jgi:hypothetical protein
MFIQALYKYSYYVYQQDMRQELFYQNACRTHYLLHVRNDFFNKAPVGLASVSMFPYFSYIAMNTIINLNPIHFWY